MGNKRPIPSQPKITVPKNIGLVSHAAVSTDGATPSLESLTKHKDTIIKIEAIRTKSPAVWKSAKQLILRINSSKQVIAREIAKRMLPLTDRLYLMAISLRVIILKTFIPTVKENWEIASEKLTMLSQMGPIERPIEGMQRC